MNKKVGKKFVIFWSTYKGKPKVARIGLSGSCNLFPGSVISSTPEIDQLAEQINAFLNGKNIRFNLEMFRFDLCSAFQEKVLRAAAAIPSGKTNTYKFIAQRLGNPKAARAVGMALASNPFPIAIPCHRVKRSDGALGGYQGGTKMKQFLLRKELKKKF